MHKYIIALTKYSEEGALTNERSFVTYDTPQALADGVAKYNKMHYQSINEEGETVVGYKQYKVEALQGEYVAISDWDTFCSVNAVLK